MSINKLFRFFALILIPLSIAGCLTCESKEYIFQFTGENSGKLTIKYINIFSSLIDSTAEVTSDYDELADLWYHGKKVEMDFPHATKFKKRLFEENGTLCGEITMEFDELSKVGLYRFMNKGPYMFSMSGANDDGENFAHSNGDFGGDKMPVIFWPEDSRTLRLTTKIATPDSTCISMLQMWEKNKHLK